MVETSVDGTEWTTAVNSVFTAAQRHQLNFVTPGAGANGVRFVRLSLLSSQGFGAPFRDLSEFGVYGRAAGVDTTDPETTLDPGGPPFTFMSNEPGATFECKVDAGEFAACTSPHAVSLPDGEHTFSVRAVDAAGNKDATPESRTFVVDATAPETTLAPGGPPFTFSSEAGATFECKVDAGDFAACTSPHAVSLPDGEHTFSVRAVDAAGNKDATPESRTFTVDTTAPETTLAPGGPPFTFSSPLTPRRRSSARSTPAVRLPLDARRSPRARRRAHSARSTTARRRHVTALVTARATHDATPETRTFVVDSTAPETGFVGVHPTLTRDTTPEFAFASSSADATFECQVDDGAWVACTSPYTTAELADGRHLSRSVPFMDRRPDARGPYVPHRHDRSRHSDHRPGRTFHSGPIAFGVECE